MNTSKKYHDTNRPANRLRAGGGGCSAALRLFSLHQTFDFPDPRRAIARVLPGRPTKCFRGSPSPMGVVGAVLCLMMLSATGIRAEPQGKLVSQWILSDFNGKEVANKVADGGTLALGNSQPPVQGEESGVKGLRFQNGECLYGKANDIPELGGFGDPGQPFSVRMVIVPLEKQVGAYGGLFEAIAFGHGGFRIVVNQQMKLGVELSAGEEESVGMGGKTNFELGTAYTIEVRFEAGKVTLIVNGFVDEEKDLPFPAPYTGPFRIGKASGQDYEFNGIIGEVSVFALKP